MNKLLVVEVKKVTAIQCPKCDFIFVIYGLFLEENTLPSLVTLSENMYCPNCGNKIGIFKEVENKDLLQGV